MQDDRVVVSDVALPYTQEQISPAMEYVQRIKQRLPSELYLEFLDILERYKRPGADEVSHTLTRVISDDITLELYRRSFICAYQDSFKICPICLPISKDLRR